jgi:hypothetical protein
MFMRRLRRGTQVTSTEALECIVDAYESGEEAGLRVTILETEGPGHPSMICTHSDGTVDLYMKQGSGWEISLACSSFDVLEPGTIEIRACEGTPGSEFSDSNCMNSRLYVAMTRVRASETNLAAMASPARISCLAASSGGLLLRAQAGCRGHCAMQVQHPPLPPLVVG